MSHYIKFALVSLVIAVFALIILSGIYIWQRSLPMTVDEFTSCDIDRDGDCDAGDVAIVTNAIGQCDDGDNYNELADADHDGCVTATDKKIVLSGIPKEIEAPMEENPVSLCDLNEDGSCDENDFQLLQSALGKCLKGFRTSAEVRADIDGDGCITLKDQMMLFPTLPEK